MGWKYRLAIRLFSKDALSHAKSEPSLIWARLLCFSPGNWRKIRRARESSRLRLILGSGPHELDGWLSVDLFPPAAGVRWDLRWKLPFADGSVSEIHCEHFLEHVEYSEEATHFLTECARVLQADGKLRLVVPDAEKYIRSYTKRDKTFWAATRSLGNPSNSFSTEMEIMNQAFRMGGAHKFMYDLKTLSELLVRCGFPGVTAGQETSGRALDLAEPWRALESLYLTADKKKVIRTLEKLKPKKKLRRLKKAA